MPWPQSAAPDLHLERARDRVGRSRTAWCANYWRGECPVQGWWWRGSQKSNKPSKPPEIDENGKKTDGFAHILAVFRSKVLNKIYSRDVFLGIHELSSSLLKPLLSYTSSKFRKSYTPPAARIRVNTRANSCNCLFRNREDI
jgi:hypothetical protein